MANRTFIGVLTVSGLDRLKSQTSVAELLMTPLSKIGAVLFLESRKLLSLKIFSQVINEKKKKDFSQELFHFFLVFSFEFFA